jgi:putative CocE/NonD family hydrolase
MDPTTQCSVQMRDGIGLETDVYRPESEEDTPAILLRTPYGDGGEVMLAEYFVQNDFSTVVQQVRGTGGSDGTFSPVSQERADAVDTVEWLLDQPWLDSTAGIGVFGMSYLLAASLSAVARFDAVRTAVNISGFVDLYDVTHRDGIGKSHHMLPWTISRAHPDVDRSTVDWENAFDATPPRLKAGIAGYSNDLWDEWCSIQGDDSRRDQWALADIVPQVDTPMLHITGWYDLCRGSTVSLYQRLADISSATQQLIIGPWHHHNLFGSDTTIGGVDFGDQSRPGLLDVVGDWYTEMLDGSRYQSNAHETQLTSDSTPVAIFLTGANEWTTFEQWPPDPSTRRELDLTADGELRSTSETGGTAPVTVTPADPVPTAGGPVFEFEPLDIDAGPVDRQRLHTRSDVALFTSAPFDRPRTVAGLVGCDLNLAPERTPCSVFAKLLDVDPGGTARVVTDGVAKITDAAGHQSIDFWGVAHEFATGHRVGLELSGTDFPRFTKCPTSGPPFEIRVRTGTEPDSRVRLPLL